MSWRKLFPAILFVCAFVAGCVLFAPAALLGWMVERASSGALLLAKTSGTVWNGSGVLVLQNDARFVSLGEYAWHIQPFGILSGGLSFAVRQGEDPRPMTARFAPFRSEVGLAEWRMVLPAQLLEALSPQLRPYRFSGKIDVESSALVLSSRGIQGSVTMNWSQAGSGLSDVHPLGDYRIAAEGHGAVLDVELSTQSGKLQLSGRGRLEQGRGLTFNGTAQVGQGVRPEELSELLHHLGPETSPGVYSLALVPQ